jgi:hypothetical protein
MPEYALWTLIISLAILSFGMSLKIAGLKHTVKLIGEENDRFIKEIAMIKNDKDKTISTLSKRHNAIMNELTQRYETQIKNNQRNTKKILEKYHRFVPPAKLAFLEEWDNKNKISYRDRDGHR